MNNSREANKIFNSPFRLVSELINTQNNKSNDDINIPKKLTIDCKTGSYRLDNIPENNKIVLNYSIEIQ